MDQWVATLIAAVVTAGTSILIAVIVSRAPKRTIHEFKIVHPTEEPEDSRIFRLLRPIAWVVFTVLILVGMNLISVSMFLWISPETEVPNRKLWTAFLLVIATLLFCIARSVSNWIKHHEP